LRKIAQSKREQAARRERRLDEITSKLVELTQLRNSDLIDEAEFLLRETALREDFDRVANGLERGRTPPLPDGRRSPARAVPRS
jgi:hypothetical protein